MQYDHEGFEITLPVYAFQNNLLKAESTSENVIIVHVVVRARMTIDSNDAKQGKFSRFLLRFWQQLLHTQYENEGVEIYLPMLHFQTMPFDNGIHHRKLCLRMPYRLDTADDGIQPYQIMPNNVKFGAIFRPFW